MADENKGYVRDEQTGKLFVLAPETKVDTAFAIFSFAYLGVALCFFLWLLFDTWARKNTIVTWFGYSPSDLQSYLALPIFRSFAYTFIGGALGGIIAGYRSCIYWHCEQRAFGWQFVWRYIFFPKLGATLALFVYAILRSGIAVIGGSVSLGETNMLLALAIGSLVGYGSPQVVKWLDSQVNKLFKVAAKELNVPNLVGLTQQEAEKTLAHADLKSGAVTKRAEPSQAGKVIDQDPKPNSLVATGTSVNVTIAE
jgi:PASTA domain